MPPYAQPRQPGPFRQINSLGAALIARERRAHAYRSMRLGTWNARRPDTCYFSLLAEESCFHDV